MIKVILMTETGRQADLFPEHMPLGEAIDRFHSARAAYTVNGTFMREEDRDRGLLEFSDNGQVLITASPKTAEEEYPGEEAPVLSPSDVKIREALLKAREALDEAIGMLGTGQDADLPF